MMDETSNSNREITAAARSMVSFSNSSRKKVYNPNNSLLSFLRDKRIENEMVILESKGSNTFDPAPTLRLAKRLWYNKQNISVKNKIFKTFKTEMDNLTKACKIGYTFSQHHHRLLIEDIMGMEVAGKELILLIHQDHQFLHKDCETWWSRRIKSIGTSDVKGRCIKRIFTMR